MQPLQSLLHQARRHVYSLRHVNCDYVKLVNAASQVDVAARRIGMKSAMKPARASRPADSVQPSSGAFYLQAFSSSYVAPTDAIE